MTTAPAPFSSASISWAARSGVLLMLLGMLMFSLNDVMGKWLVSTYSVGQVVFIRSIAALIVLLANSQDTERTSALVAILISVMVLNLLAMLFARKIMAGVTLIALHILGAVLGVLQVALAVEMILRALGDLNVL